jgi:septal ring-binding cell division protein DamX
MHLFGCNYPLIEETMMRFTGFFLIFTLTFFYTGIVSADLEEGFQAYERGDYEAAVNAWLPLAEQGDVTAQFNLGQMYRLGKGVTRDDDEAVKWYKLAAQQGSPHAQHNLRLMHRDGRANQQDYEEIFGKDADSSETVATAPTPPPSTSALETPTMETSSMESTAASVAAASQASQLPQSDSVSQPALPQSVEPPSTVSESTTAMTAMDDASKMQPAPQPVAEPAKAPVPAPVQSPPTQTAMLDSQPPAQSMPARSTSTAGDSADWLQRLNPSDYLVQLIASPNQTGVDKFLAANGGSLPAQFNTARTWSKGRQWHVVLMGPFANRNQARAAISQLPAGLRRNNPWIRQVSTVLAAVR